jgi:DNA-binding PadR family transcriptional regulator
MAPPLLHDHAMPVKHAFLALLDERDLTGYELKIRFERALGEFWQLNSGQVYSTVERLRCAGLVARRRDVERVAEGAPPPPPSRRTARTRYTLTERGRRELDQWLRAPLARLRPVRDATYVRLVFGGPERAGATLALVDAELRRYRTAVETLGALVAREPVSHVGRTRWLVAEAVRLQYEAHAAWLATVRAVLAPVETPAPPSPSHRPPVRAALRVRPAATGA